MGLATKPKRSKAGETAVARHKAREREAHSV